jgi:hypothetical protein
MASVHDLTQQSGFVFEAQLQQLGASAASGYPSAPETAVVRVTKILKSTPALSGYEGQLITVHLQTPVTLKAGQPAVFFTHGVHYGDTLVVGEVGHAPGTASSQEADLSSAAQASDEAEITLRLAQADLVISGVASAPTRYAATPALSVADTVRRFSEHDPDWWSSTITVETVEKGVHSAKTKDILFAHSMDIAWYRSPKVKAGDHGVWLLHNRSVLGRGVPAAAISHPLDFRPIEDLARVRDLLKK